MANLFLWLRQRSASLGQPLSRYSRLALLPLGISAAVLILRWSGVLQAMELSVLDRFFQFRPLAPPDERVILVRITEADLQAAARWPLPDQAIAPYSNVSLPPSLVPLVWMFTAILPSRLEPKASRH